MNTKKLKQLNSGRERSGALAVMAGILILSLILAGCSGTSARTSSDYKGKTIAGEVTKAGSDSITIKLKEMGGPGKESDSDGEEKKEENSEGELVKLDLTDDTKITKGGEPMSGGEPQEADSDSSDSEKGSEAICVEGKNSVKLFNSELSGNMKDDEQNDCTWNVIVYQSMSGDAEEGEGSFEMNGGKLTAKNGGMFYTTNTSSRFILKDVDIKYADDNDFFFKATGNSNARSWGKKGSNGADTEFTAISQKMNGDVIWDKISKVDFYITDGSLLKGAVKQDNSNAGSGKGGYCSVYIDEDSSWIVTGNSKVTNLYNAGTIRDKSGKTVTVKDSDGKVLVKGNSKFTITVEKYSEADKTDGAAKASSWKSYTEEKPSQLS